METALIEKLKANKANHELLNALLLTAHEKWEAAHNIAQLKEGELLYDRLHALLHRIEGDEWNAKYWYRRVNKPYGKMSITEEWNELASEYLEKLS